MTPDLAQRIAAALGWSVYRHGFTPDSVHKYALDAIREDRLPA